MSAPFLIPFNFQPINTVVGSSGTYTVPANKYAYATVTLNSTIGLLSFTSTGIVSPSRQINALTINNGSKVFGIYLKAGDVLSFDQLSASGFNSGNIVNSQMPYNIMINTTAARRALVNSNLACSAVASLTFDGTYSGSISSVGVIDQGVSTTTSFSFIISEYNVIGV